MQSSFATEAGPSLALARPEGTAIEPDLSLRLSSDPRAATVAREALDALEGRVDGDLLSDLRLLVTELVTNSVRHGHGGPGSSVHVEVSVRPEVVRAEVTDAGPGFSPAARSPVQDEASGWGLVLVEELADRWGVHSDVRNLVWFEIDHVRP